MAGKVKAADRLQKQLDSARKKMEEARERAEKIHKIELQKRRLDIAKTGVLAYSSKRMAEAVRQYHLYLSVSEEIKKCGEGNLHPKFFDVKKDLTELLLIAGIYWDLAKVYDRTKSREKQRDFRHYLDQFVLFSKGMPFQPLSAETMRKYIVTGKTYHRSEFQNAYSKIGSNQCFVATALADVSDPGTLPKLRRFRDEFLEKRPWGRLFVRCYYRVGPLIADRMATLPDPMRRRFGQMLDQLADWFFKINVK